MSVCLVCFGIVARTGDRENGWMQMDFFEKSSVIPLNSMYAIEKLEEKSTLCHNGKRIFEFEGSAVQFVDIYFVSVFPHIFFCQIQLLYFWYIFYFCVCVAAIWAVMAICFKDFSHIFFVSDTRIKVARIFYFFTFMSPWALAFLFLCLWAFLLKYSLWLNTLVALVCVIFFDASINKYREMCGDFFSVVKTRFLVSRKQLFQGKEIFFRKILYDETGLKKYFIVKTFQGDWVLIDNNLKLIGEYTFHRFVKKKGQVFIMKKGSDLYYVYINGAIPRINRLLNQEKE